MNGHEKCDNGIVELRHRLRPQHVHEELPRPAPTAAMAASRATNGEECDAAQAQGCSAMCKTIIIQ